MGTSYNISKQVKTQVYDQDSRGMIEKKILDSVKVEVSDLSPEVLAQDDVFGLTAFTEDTSADRDRVIKQMTNLRDAIDWKSEVTNKPYDSKVYGKGYAITVMKKAVVPKVNEDDMNGFIASLAGNSSA